MLLHDEQAEARSFIDRNLRDGTISASYLFTGVRGIGKRELALYVAKRLNCQMVSLGEEYSLCSCRACHKIDSGNHPDVTILGEDLSDRSIKIEAVRDLQQWLSLKPFEGECKVVLVCEAERLTTEAQNALLKTLEEPPPQTVIILTAVQPLQLLPTILSRVTDVRLMPLSLDLLGERLKLECSLGDEAHVLAYMSNGSFERGKELAESDLLKERTQLLEALFSRRFETYTARYETKQHQTLQQVVPHMIDIVLCVCRDLLVVCGMETGAQGDGKQFVNRDVAEQLCALGSDITTTRITTAFRELQTLRHAVKSNGNLKLLLSHLLVTVNSLVV